MQSIAEYKQFLLMEQHAERKACSVILGENFTQCLKLSNYPTSIQVPNRKGDPITIQGRDIYNSKTWEKFLLEVQPEDDLRVLTGVANRLAKQYDTWLRTGGYTERYTFFNSDDAVLWLRNVTLMAVIRRIVENKRQSSAFADDYSADAVADIFLLHEFARDLAKAVNHGIKEQERAMELITAVCEQFTALIDARKRKMADPLPPLPAGTPPPLLLPNELDGMSDE